jgi:hypothetical protein
MSKRKRTYMGHHKLTLHKLLVMELQDKPAAMHVEAIPPFEGLKAADTL